MTDSLTLVQLLLIAGAGLAGGAVNALAGGGTLITFPVLTAVGLPPVAASITNTVALSPGYLGATLAQRQDLRGQAARLRWLMPAGALGGIVGGLLLLNTTDRVFRELVPVLILLAAGLLALQDRLRAWLLRRVAQSGRAGIHNVWAVPPVFAASIYGGYFGAGLSVIVLAVLGLVLEDSLTRLNGLKQAIAFSVNITAAIFFLFSGQVVWPAAIAMAVGALLGGSLGGRLAGRVKPAALRRIVVIIGLIVGVVYLIRGR
ncbi:MAG: sulfite exporter TauE/SafE family protein [Thermoflexales bacterium]|nr:sulfite exporter TauE/SafE family protein [Thermoflexales bacterium]